MEKLNNNDQGSYTPTKGQASRNHPANEESTVQTINSESEDDRTVVDSERARRKQAARQNGEAWVCSNDETVNTGEFCIICNSPRPVPKSVIPPEEVVLDEQPPQPQKQTTVPKPDQTPPPEKEPKPKKKKALPAVLAAILALALAAGGGYSYFARNAAPSGEVSSYSEAYLDAQNRTTIDGFDRRGRLIQRSFEYTESGLVFSDVEKYDPQNGQTVSLERIARNESGELLSGQVYHYEQGRPARVDVSDSTGAVFEYALYQYSGDRNTGVDSYDSDGRMKSRMRFDFSESGENAGYSIETYEDGRCTGYEIYDKDGKPLAFGELKYDAAGLLVSDAVQDKYHKAVETTYYEYDSSGNQIKNRTLATDGTELSRGEWEYEGQNLARVKWFDFGRLIRIDTYHPDGSVDYEWVE